MAQYPTLTITTKAIEMIAESQLSGTDLEITRVKIGSGQLAEDADIKSMTDIINALMEAPISSSTNDGKGQVTIHFAVSNSSLETGFFAREIGVFAKLADDESDVLYAYTNAGNLCDWIPDKSTPIDSQIIDCTLIVGEASSVTVNVSDMAYVLVQDLIDHNVDTTAHADIRAGLTSGISEHNTDTSAHEDIRESLNYVKKHSGVVGQVIAYAGNNTLPEGYLLCDGSAVSRTDYADLFAVIGTTYGTGNGSTTFNLPNLVGRFIEGGSTAGTVYAAGLPNITASGFWWDNTGASAVSKPKNIKGALYIDTSLGNSNQGSGSSDTDNAVLSFNASRCSSIYGNSTTVQPPALTLKYIIKY